MFDLAYLQRVERDLSGVETWLADHADKAHLQEFRQQLARHARLKSQREEVAEVLRLRRTIEECQAMLDDPEVDPELAGMARDDLETAQAALPAAERQARLALVPEDPTDARNAIIEIRAGTGGDEAALFAANLYRMYQRYAETRGWRTQVLDSHASDLGGFKEIIFSVEGDEVMKHLRYESGTHRVQRVPVTEAQGRIHTSAATVAVMAEAEAQDEIPIKPEEIRVDIFRSSGPGGQSVNTTDSAVRITHLPTGLIVQCQDEKSQHRNREKALRVLQTRLLDQRQQEEAARQSAERRLKIGTGDRSGRIRTYNFPQNRVTDHRINCTLYSLDRFMEGDLEELLGQLRETDLEDRLRDRLAETDDA